MRLEWLDDILAIADLGSLKAAAARRHLSQPAFSRRLKLIEESLGTALFDRSHRPIALLPHGRAQVDRLRAIAQELRDVRAALQKTERVVARKLVIVSQHAITTATAPSVVERLSGLNIAIRLRSANRDACIAQVVTREADIALVYEMDGEHTLPGIEHLSARTIGRELLRPVFSSTGFAALKAGMARGDLPIVSTPADVYFGIVQTRHILPQLGALEVRPMLETALMPAALQFALAGVGVAWVPQTLAAPSVAAGALVYVDDLPALPMTMIAIRLMDRTAVLVGEAFEAICAGERPQSAPTMATSYRDTAA